MQLQQRDHEINILVSMLNKNGGNAAAAAAAAGVTTLPAPGGGGMGGAPMPLGPANGQRQGAGGGANGRGGGPMCPAPPPPQPPAPTAEELALARERKQQAVEAAGASGTEEANALLERNAAFEAFRRSYRKHEVIEDNKLLLKQKYDEAKRLGETVNAARAQINTLKGQIEACRRDRAISEVAASEGGEGSGAMDAATQEEEARLKAQMEEGKRTYKEGFAKLKELKGEIEHLQHLLEQSRRKLQQDFEGWYAKQQQAGAMAPPAGYEGAAPQSHMQMMPQMMPPQQPQPIQPSPPRGSGAAAAAAAAASRGMGGPSAPPGAASPTIVMPPKRFTLGGGGGAGGSPRRTPANPRVAPPAAYGSPPQECWGSPGKDKPSAPPDHGAPNLPPGAGGGGGPMLTGQPEVDKEIMAFYQARDSLVKQRMANKQ